MNFLNLLEQRTFIVPLEVFDLAVILKRCLCTIGTSNCSTFIGYLGHPAISSAVNRQLEEESPGTPEAMKDPFPYAKTAS